MNAIELLLDRHNFLHTRGISFVWDRVSGDQMRERPTPATNSIAWCIWHMARCEDVGLNRLVTDRPQVLETGEWQKKLNVPVRVYGTGMSDDEVAEFSAVVDLKALRAYYDAVGRQSVGVISSVRLDDLDTVVGDDRLRKVLREEGVIGANAEWVPSGYAGHNIGWFLAHLGVTHNFSHMGEANAIAGFLGARGRTTEGQVRAAPDWKLTHAPAKGR